MKRSGPWWRASVFPVVALSTALAWWASAGAQALATPPQPTVLLVSFDGFRADYLDRFPTPNLTRLIRAGVRAAHLIPVFPTKTYPNHYTIVTGLYPDHHGIVQNDMFDPLWNRRFDRRAVGTSTYDEWWGGEPIWVTARRQGLVSSAMFWPGSDAEIRGWRPTDWSPYDGAVTTTQRVTRVFEWLDRPAARRPSIITLYLSDTDEDGHRVGPASTAMAAAVGRLDAAAGTIVAGLEARKLSDSVDLVIVSDHGMTQTSPERVISVDDLIAMDDVEVSDWTPVLSLWPKPGRGDRVYARLKGANPHLAVYRPSELPPRWHLGANRRVAPILGVAEEGWTIGTHEQIERFKRRWNYGSHGYDNALASMQAIFIAAGPHFKRGASIPAFENVHVYALLCHVLNLRPAPNDGDLAATAAALAER